MEELLRKRTSRYRSKVQSSTMIIYHKRSVRWIPYVSSYVWYDDALWTGLVNKLGPTSFVAVQQPKQQRSITRVL